MGLDIYISRKTSSGEECLIHWRKFEPVAEWFKVNVYGGKLDTEQHTMDYFPLFYLHECCIAVLNSENWKEKMSGQLFPIKNDFVWTGRRELAYLKMMETIAEDTEAYGQLRNEELLIRITY